MKNMRLYRRENGVFYVETSRGQKRSLKTKNERTAQRVFNVMKREYLKGRLIQLDSSDRTTLAEFGTEYIENRSDLDDDTLRMDSLVIRSLGDVIGHNTPLKLINDKSIIQFVDACKKRGLSRYSINTYLRHLRAAFNVAVEKGHIKKPPKIKRLKTGNHLPRILTSKELDNILTHAYKCDVQLWRIILFALWTGSRREEIKNVLWQNVTQTCDSTTCRICGKGDKERTIPLLPKALEAMGEQKNIGPVFQQWHKDTISKRFKAIARVCGIEDVHFHNLRHTSATQMLKSGIPLEVVQKILGHVDIRTTQIYAQVVDELMEKEMQKLQF